MDEITAYKNGTFSTNSNDISDDVSDDISDAVSDDISDDNDNNKKYQNRGITNDIYHTDEYNRTFVNQTYGESGDV
jgi:hypothetical protein